ncbi:uncharacterized protein LOC141946026 [Strix uralensis]|uniref:uncharacterized protein LOC141946026 n=1 Tax=Strix uralensis TaxID=36305 RepID=UPI003DA74A7E
MKSCELTPVCCAPALPGGTKPPGQRIAGHKHSQVAGTPPCPGGPILLAGTHPLPKGAAFTAGEAEPAAGWARTGPKECCDMSSLTPVPETPRNRPAQHRVAMTPRCLHQSAPGGRHSARGIYQAGGSPRRGGRGKQHLPSKHRQQHEESPGESARVCRMRPWDPHRSLPPSMSRCTPRCPAAPGCFRAGAHAHGGCPTPPLQRPARSALSLSPRICRRRHVAQLGLVTAGDAWRQLGRREGNCNGLSPGRACPSRDPKHVGREALPPARGVPWAGSLQGVPGKVLTSEMSLPCCGDREGASPTGREHSSAPLLPLSAPTTSL